MVLDWVMSYKWILLFYAALIVLLIIKRKNVVTQAKIIVMYRTQFGIKFIEYIATKYRELVRIFGLSGIGIGFCGMIAISLMLVFGIVQAFRQPELPSSVTLVLPGMDLPGLGVLSFWHWLAAIFIIAAVHEFSHGIVAYAHGLHVKFTGLVFLGPILGAFVEPDEKKLLQADDVVQYSVYAAGAFSNIVLAVLAMVVMSFISVPLQSMLVTPSGFTFDSYAAENLPFEKVGIPIGTTITGIDGQKTESFQQFNDELIIHRPGGKIQVQTAGKTYTVTLAQHPDIPKRGYLGIIKIRNVYDKTYTSSIGGFFYHILEWFNGLQNNGRGFLFWLYALSFGIGLFNLLPLPIVDGGRMVQTGLKRKYGEERGNVIYGKVSLAFFILLIASFIVPAVV